MPDFDAAPMAESFLDLDCECLMCRNLIIRLLAVPANEFAAPILQAEVLYHFKHHDRYIPMIPEFAAYGTLMAAVCEQQLEMANVQGLEMLDIQDHSYDHVEMDIGEYFDFNQYDCVQNHSYDHVEMDMGEYLDFSQYDWTPEANAIAQDPMQMDCTPDVNEIPQGHLADADDSDSTLGPSDSGSQPAVHAANQARRKAIESRLASQKAYSDSDSESSSDLTEVTDVSMLDPDRVVVEPKPVSLRESRRQARLEAKAKAAPFAYLRMQEEEEDSEDDSFQRKVARRQRIERWVNQVEAARAQE